jgi:hypothetical protein
VASLQLLLVARADIYGRERWARVAETSVRNRMLGLSNVISGVEIVEWKESPGEACAKPTRALTRV